MNHNLPEITLVVAIYFPPGPDGQLRANGFHQSVRSWKQKLRYRGHLRLTVVNDGEKACRGRLPGWCWPDISRLSHPRSGLGGSLNLGFRAAFESSPLAALMVDDWVLAEPYDLTPWAEMLLDDEAVGTVHLSAPYPGCTGTVEPRRHGWVVRMNRHNLVAGLRPCLYHKRFFNAYGGFDEGLSAWETERLFNERFCQAVGPESVLALPLPWQEGIGAVIEMGQRSPVPS